jgi:hypothetical protein
MAAITEPQNAVPKMPQVVAVYAQEDIWNEDVKDATGKVTTAKKIVHAKGFAQELPPAVAREVVRESKGRYAFEPPPGSPALAAAVGAAALAEKEQEDKFNAAMNDPVLMARLRAAMGGGETAPRDIVMYPEGDVTKPVPVIQQGPVAPKTFDLRALPGVDDKLARAMEDAKFGTLVSLQNTTPEKLAEVPGMGGKLAIKVLAYVNENFPKGV